MKYQKNLNIIDIRRVGVSESANSEVEAVGVKLLGTVIHYYGNLSVAVLDLKEQLTVKDLVAFRGATTDFEQEIESMQVDHQNIEVAGGGQEVAVKVKDKVRVGDSVYRVDVD